MGMNMFKDYPDSKAFLSKLSNEIPDVTQDVFAHTVILKKLQPKI